MSCSGIGVLTLVLLASFSWTVKAQNERGYQEDGCVPSKVSCLTTNDPHLRSFDQRWLHYMATCTYILTQNRCRGGFPSKSPSFVVYGDFSRWRKRRQVSGLHYVIIDYDNVRITIDVWSNLTVQAVAKDTGATLLASDAPVVQVHPHITIVLASNFVDVTTTFGLHVHAGLRYYAEIYVSNANRGRVCGLCGDFDGNGWNDWVVGPTDACSNGSVAIPGSLTSETNIFGDSWRSWLDEDWACEDTCGSEDVINPCEEDTVALDYALEHCYMIADLDGPFQRCIEEIGPAETDTVYQSCLTDVCADPEFLCQALEDLATRCQTQYNINTDWRDEANCPFECPENMEYVLCFDPCTTPRCPSLFLTSADDQVCDVQSACREGCQCATGLLWNGHTCISQSECRSVQAAMICGNRGPPSGLFADGREVAPSGEGEVATFYDLPAATISIAVQCDVTPGSIPGMLGSSSTGHVTDGTWKCSYAYFDGWEMPDYDDRRWANAVGIASNSGEEGAMWWHVPDVSSKAQWIMSGGERMKRHLAEVKRRAEAGVDGEGDGGGGDDIWQFRLYCRKIIIHENE